MFRAFQNYIVECVASNSDFAEALAPYCVDPERIRRGLIDIPPMADLGEELRALRDEEDRIEVGGKYIAGGKKLLFFAVSFSGLALNLGRFPRKIY